MSEEPQSEAPREPPLAESPLFWIAVFGGMAVLGLAVIGPKYARRHEGLVRKYEARSQPRGEAASSSTPLPPGGDEHTHVGKTADQSRGDVRPIALFVGIVILVAALGAIIVRRRHRRWPKTNHGAEDIAPPRQG